MNDAAPAAAGIALPGQSIVKLRQTRNLTLDAIVPPTLTDLQLPDPRRDTDGRQPFCAIAAGLSAHSR